MNKRDVIKKTQEYVKKILEREVSGHDWWHTYRVWKISLRLAKKEKNVNLFVIELAALLHDIEDWKLCNNYSASTSLARKWLENMKVDEEIISHVCEIIRDISFKGAYVKSNIKTKEGKIVQDADRLDAIGAIGIARCFATGAKLGKVLHNPNIKPRLHKNFYNYKISKTTTVNHFYEKLLLLKKLMNTKEAKKIAEKRDRFMRVFLKRFFKEWYLRD